MNIWVPKAKILEPKRELIVKSRVQGFIRMEARRRDGRRRLLADWFPNLITDAGLEAIGTTDSWMTACKVGTGATAPSVADTTMDNFVAGTVTLASVDSTGAQLSPPYYAQRTKTYRFDEGDAAGNLAEVGFGAAATDTGVLFSRALILDGGGSSTTITVLPDEFLDCTYQLRTYPFLDDIVGTINISGIDYDYTLRASDVDSTAWAVGAAGSMGGGGGTNAVSAYAGAIGAITDGPSGTNQPVNSNNLSYGALNHYRDFTAEWGLLLANFGGVLSASATMGNGIGGNMGRMQMQFDPVIPKDGTNILTLIFRHSWARGSI